MTPTTKRKETNCYYPRTLQVIGEEGIMEGRKEMLPPDENSTESPRGPDAPAQDSAVPDAPPQEGGPEQLTDRTQEDPGKEDASAPSEIEVGGTGGSLSLPEEHTADMPVPLLPSLQLSILNAGGEGKETETVGDEPNEELVVLDPEHPLMKRFQLALKNHLSKQLEGLNMELREMSAEERAESTRREELGVELYGVQQQLARLQASLESRQEDNRQAAQQRQLAQERLEEVRGQHRTAASETGQQRTQVSRLQAEVDSLALHLIYVREVNEDLRSDISAMKNASQKAKAEKLHAEEEKQKQDLYVERLTKHTEKLTEQIAMYDVQIAAQAEETQAAKQVLTEAQMEMDTLEVERKQLLQQWNSSLLGMKRRNEAYSTMQETLRVAHHQVRSMDTEIEGLRKSAVQEAERNELLTALLNRSQADHAASRRLTAQSRTQQEVLQAQYSTYARMLQETEQALAHVSGECAAHEAKLAALCKKAEKESSVRLELEEKIVAKMQEQLTHDNSAKYSKRLMLKTTAHRRETEAQVSRLENDIAQVTLESFDTTQHLESLTQLLAELEQEAESRHKLLSRSEAEVNRGITVIGCKQTTINVYNKKIEQIVASTGHEDLGPLEIRMSNLTKQLEEVGSEIKEAQQLWLWQQGELVRLNQERQARSSALLTLQMQLTILQQKKVRTESEIQQEQRELVELDRHTRGLEADMLKLNTLLNKNGRLREELEQGNALMQSDFLHRLKEAEKESVAMQMKLEKIQEEKERLLNSLVEAEQQMMLWEKKIQLMKETRSVVDSDISQEEIRSMKAEIHRMEVRHAQLVKQQERLLRDMEAEVVRREAIAVHSEVQARADRKQPTQTDFYNILQNLRRKIQDTQKQAEECDGVIKEMAETQQKVAASLAEKQRRLSELQSSTAVLTAELRHLQDAKEQNLVRLLGLQGRARHLRAVREGSYVPTAASKADTVEPTIQQQEDRLNAFSTVLHRICQELPQHQGTLRRLSLALAARLQGPQASSRTMSV
ncbi:coiled-coil domain-containing protein 40 isoform X1 [Arapaima gigas]